MPNRKNPHGHLCLQTKTLAVLLTSKQIRIDRIEKTIKNERLQGSHDAASFFLKLVSDCQDRNCRRQLGSNLMK